MANQMKSSKWFSGGIAILLLGGVAVVYFTIGSTTSVIPAGGQESGRSVDATPEASSSASAVPVPVSSPANSLTVQNERPAPVAKQTRDQVLTILQAREKREFRKEQARN